MESWNDREHRERSKILLAFDRNRILDILNDTLQPPICDFNEEAATRARTVREHNGNIELIPNIENSKPSLIENFEL